LYGDTSGFVDLKAPDVASNVTITLPNTTGPFATETYVDDEIAAIPAIAGIGSNVVQATTRTTFTTTSSTFVDVTDLSVTITPTSATSKILVIAATNMQDDTSSYGWEGRIQGGNIPADYFWKGRTLGQNAGDYTASMLLAAPMMYLDSPATTSATTYKVQVLGVSAATVYVNRAKNVATAGRSTLIAIEVAV
jgi:hypothetical protein